MSFGMFGAAAALGISAFGSALGLAIAGQGTIGAWKRCYLNNAASAIAQGKASAAGSDALAETGKGFGQYITVVGLCETVALFVMVFGLINC